MYCIYDYSNYTILFYFILFSFTLIVIILSLITQSVFYYENTSGYECGFNPFSNLRKLYSIVVLMILFDIEIIFFFPYIFSTVQINYFGIFILYLFIIMMSLGFIYKWNKHSIK